MASPAFAKRPPADTFPDFVNDIFVAPPKPQPAKVEPKVGIPLSFQKLPTPVSLTPDTIPAQLLDPPVIPENHQEPPFDQVVADDNSGPTFARSASQNPPTP